MPSPRRRPSQKSFHPRIRILCDDEIAIGPGKAELLELIHETGSLREAAKRMGISYMRAWSLVRTMNGCFKNPIVISTRGGSSGGGAELTATGRKALALYQKINVVSLRATQSHWKKLQTLLRD